jgi:hypothetical protein
MKQYNLVFEGAVSDGRKVEEVKTNLATLFKVDENKIDHLFTAPSAVLKKNINYDVAMQYQHALKKAGAICKVTEVIENIDQQAPTIWRHSNGWRCYPICARSRHPGAF